MATVRRTPPRSVTTPGEHVPFVRRQNLLTPMRDGVQLAMDVLMPTGGGPYPAVLRRTPYNKNDACENPTPLMRGLLAAGYAIAVQDCRGRFNSDGEFDAYFQEGADGADTLEWLADQAWCDGRIAMFGGSYSGATQWYAAMSGSKHLKAIVPVCSNPASLWENEPFRGGAMLTIQVEYAVEMGRRSFQRSDFMERIYAEERKSAWTLPVSEMAAADGAASPWLDAMLAHPTFDAFWARGNFDAWDQIRAPALNVTGWWDLNFPGAITNYPAMKTQGATADAREGQRLVIGPWAHIVNRDSELNGVDFGPNALINLDGYVIDYLNYHVLDRDTGIDDQAAVHVFITGANEWWASDCWPLEEATDTKWYLGSDGHANSHDGDGSLSRAAPVSAASDTFEYDPADPVHAFFNPVLDGPVDDRSATSRPDVLCYTSPPLSEPLDVVGPVSANLWATTSAADTDWHVRLVDVWPDGSARYLCHGVIRARFRSSLSNPELLTPGAPHEFVIAMDAVGVRFGAGHRIRVEVTSSWFPRYTRNTNTGAANPQHDAMVQVARQTIHHGHDQHSYVTLPVVPSD